MVSFNARSAAYTVDSVVSGNARSAAYTVDLSGKW